MSVSFVLKHFNQPTDTPEKQSLYPIFRNYSSFLCTPACQSVLFKHKTSENKYLKTYTFQYSDNFIQHYFQYLK